MTLRSAGMMALLVFGTSAFGQVDSTAPIADESGVATVEQEGFSGGVSLNGTYFDVRHQTSSGVGYRGGFTQFGAFAPIWGSPDWFVAPTGRMTLTDDLATGFNAGAVARFYSERFDRIFGVNAFYDYDQSTNNNRYSQAGFGAESLGRIIDVRGNAYLPTSTESNFLRATSLSNNLVFFENRLGFIGTQLMEQSLAGGDAEIGAPLKPDMPWLRGYVGGYAYRQNDGTTTAGFRGRVEGWVTNDLSLGAMVTSDELFGTNVNFTADWRFAGFQPTRTFPNWTTRDRMLMPVQRQWRVSTAEIDEGVNIAADNPRKIAAGDADTRYFVVWVDPDRVTANPGTGTFEDPFHTMPPAVPGNTDLVLVVNGDTTAANPLDGPIALPDFARMLGEGREHFVQASATFGAFSQTTLPTGALLPDARFTNTGNLPFLTNTAGNIVTAGNHNEIAAFVMQGAAGAAIAGTNTNGFNFHHLEIRDNNGGIVLTGARGAGNVDPINPLDQTILGGQITDINRNLVLSPLGLGDNGALGGVNAPGGIDISTGIGLLDLNLERISMNATPGALVPQSYGIRLRAVIGALDANMQDIQTNGGNAIAGVSIEQQLGQVDVVIGTSGDPSLGLTSSQNAGVGLQLLTGSLRPMTVNGFNVIANQNAGHNLSIDDNPVVALIHNSNFIAAFTDSTFDGSTGGNGIDLNMTAGSKTLGLNNVSASGNTSAGAMGVNLVSTAALPPPATTLTFFAEALTATGNDGNNLNIALTNTAFDGEIRTDTGNSVFDGSLSGSGIVLTATGGTASLDLNVLPATVNSLSASGNFVDGLRINALGGAQIGNSANAIFDGVNVHQSTLIGNGGIAINQFVAGGSHLEVFVDPTNVSNSGFHNIRFDVSGGSTFVALYDQTTIDNSGTNPGAIEFGRQGRGIFGLVDGLNSVATVTVQDSSIVGSADDGVYLGTLNGAVANLTLTNVNVQNSGSAALSFDGSGVELNGASGSTINLTLNGTTVLNNTVAGGPAEYGLFVTSAGAGTNVNVTSTDTNFDNAGTNAVQAIVSTGGTATFEFTGATGTNAVDGLNVVVNAGSVFNACLMDTHFDGFSGAGMRILTTGIGAESNIHMEDSSANDNDLGGLVALVNLGGQLNLRTINTTFDGNGTDPGLSDGVFIRAENAGSTALLLFNTTSANNNQGDESVAVHRGNGFNFEADDGAYMTARLDSITATGNDGYGVRFDAQNAGTNAFLIFEGTNNTTVPPNGLGSYSINYSNTDTAIVALNGSFNGMPGDGVNVSISNVGTALVSVTGNGTDTIDGNGGDGIDISISNAEQAGIRIAGYSSISNNTGGDGIHIVLTNIVDNIMTAAVPAAAVEILGPTVLAGNSDDGVDITLNNVVLGTLMLPTGIDPLRVVALGFNDPLNACLPEETILDLSSVVAVPVSNGILIDQLTISRVGAAAVAGRDGISISGSNVDGTGLVTLTNNTITNFNNGINAAFVAGSSFGGLTIDNAIINTSSASGIAVTMNAGGAPILITDSTIDISGADGMRLNLDGATGGFDVTKLNNTISNSGGMGINLTAVGATLGTIIDPSTVTNSQGDGVHIDLTNATFTSLFLDQMTITNSGLSALGGDGLEINLDGATGGPVTVSNTDVTNSTDRGVYIHGSGALNLGDVLLDTVASTTTNNAEGVFVNFGTGTIGSVNLNTVSATDSGGTGLRVVLETGLTVGPTVSINGGGTAVSDDNVGDGISLVLSNVTGTPDVNISGYNSVVGVDSNGGRGIELSSSLTDVGAVTVLDNNVSNSGSAGSPTAQGVLINLSNNAVGSLEVGSSTAAIVTIDNSFGRGLDVVLDGVTTAPTIDITNLAVTNSGTGLISGRGVSVSGTGVATTAIGNVTLTNVSSDSTGAEEGVAVVFDTLGTAVGSINLTGVSANDSTLGGILIDLDAVTVGSPIALTGGSTSFSTNNGGDGIRIDLNNLVSAPSVSVTGYQLAGPSAGVDTNVGHGIAVIGSGTTDLGSVTISDNIVNDNSAGDGILFQLASGNSLSGPVTLNANTVDLSFGDGIHLVLDGVTGGVAVSTTNSNIDGSGANGINLTAVGATLGTITLDPSTVANSGLDGVHIDLTGATITGLTVQDFTITNSSLFASGVGDGLEILLDRTKGTPFITVDNVSVSNTAVPLFDMDRGVSISGAGTGAGVNQMLLGNVRLTDVTSLGATVNEGVAVEFNANAAANGVIGTLTLDNVSADSSGSTGILVDLNTVTIGSSISLTGGPASFSTNNGGDGIRVELDTVTGTPAISVIDYSDVFNNNGNGIAVVNNGSAVGAVTVSGNTVGTSTLGDGILVDLSGTIGVVELDNNFVSDSSNNGINVVLVGATGSNVTISDSTVTNSAGGDGVRLFMNGSTLNDLRIVNVDVTNSNIDGIAVLDVVGPGSSINRIELTDVDSDTTNLGTGVTVQLTNTTNLADDIAINGTGTVIDSAFDGINVVLNGVTGTPDITIDGYTVGQSGNRGIFIDTNASPVGAVTVANFAVSNSGTLINNQAQGVVLDLTNSAVGSVLVNNTNLTTNTIDDSFGRGLDVILDGVTLATTIDISDTDVTNSGLGGVLGRGVSVAGVGSAGNQMLLGTNALTGQITLTNVSSTTTGAEEGVVVALLADAPANGKVGDILLTGVSAIDSFAGGILTSLTDMTIDPSITIDGNLTAQVSGNGGDGILVTLNNTVTGVPTPVEITIENNSFVDDNFGRGIALVSNGNALGLVTVSNNTVTDSTNGEGIQIDIAGSELLQLVMDGNTIANSSNRGLDVILDGVNRGANVDAPVISISNTTVGQSGGRGVSVAGSGATTDLGDIMLTNVGSTLTDADEGVAVVFAGGATLDRILLNGVSADQSFTTGILVDLNTVNVVGATILVDGGTSTNNGTGGAGDGIRVNLVSVTGTPDVNIDNYSSVSTNAGGGILLVADNTPLDNVSVFGNTINGNTAGNGLTVDLSNGSNATDLTISANIIGTNAGDGIFLSQDNSNVGPIYIGTDSLGSTGLGNTITGNAANGINFVVTNSNQGTVTLAENQISGHTAGDGVHVGPLDDNDGSLDFDFFRNTISNNTGGDGVSFTLPNAVQLTATLNATFTNDTISTNGQHGIHVDLTANVNSDVTANVTILSDNGLGLANPVSGNDFSDISDNTGMGLYINSSLANVTNTNDIVLTVGGTGGVNLFNSNLDAGIGVALGGSSTLQANVSNASFTATTNGALANFNGDGIAVVMTNDTEFSNSVFDDLTYSGNAGSGFALRTTNAAFADSLTFSDSTFNLNTTNGLLFLRNSTAPDAGFIHNISIDNNDIIENGVGINLAAQFAATTDTYSITDNLIDFNTSHGIQLSLVADANMGLLLDSNNITDNRGDGINARTTPGFSDAPEYAIQSTNDTITGNTGDGIDLIALHNVSIDFGDISDNGGNGVSLNGSNTFGNPFSVTPFLGATTNVSLVGNSITNSVVNDNNLAGVVMTNQALMVITIANNEIQLNTLDGIDLFNSGDMTSKVMFALIDGNFIGFNGGDGIQYSGIGTGGNQVGNPGTFTAINEYDTPFTTLFGNNFIDITGNELTVNGARGINILNGGNIATDLSITGNTVDRSTLEGVYIVNTVSTTQNVDANANNAMAQGSALADPRLGLTVVGNQITSNAQIIDVAAVFDTTGLVVRVSTSDASNSIRDNGGFASNAATTSATISANGGLVSQMGRGGVQALVTDNTFGGQFGADVTFQAYIGTDPPATTTGAWTDQNEGDSSLAVPTFRDPTNDLFRIDSYTSDPLARLDLVFNNNTNGDNLRATRADAANVFYNNAEAVFKSRTQGQDGNDREVGGINSNADNTGDDGGPFDSGTRNRNATRLANNTGIFNRPVGVGTEVDVQDAVNLNGNNVIGNGFLYPGVSGSSTFRRDTSAGGNVFTTSSQGFGATIPQGAGFGEFAFLWSLLP